MEFDYKDKNIKKLRRFILILELIFLIILLLILALRVESLILFLTITSILAIHVIFHSFLDLIISFKSKKIRFYGHYDELEKSPIKFYFTQSIYVLQIIVISTLVGILLLNALQGNVKLG